MTTKITVDTHAGLSVCALPIGPGNYPSKLVEPHTTQVFYIHKDCSFLFVEINIPTGIAEEHIMQFFSWQHLPPRLQSASAPFEIIARNILTTLPRNPERTVALRKLLEAKDAAVRAMIAN